MQACVRRTAALAPALLALWPVASGTAAAPCWERLLQDWRANGRVDGVYPISCYRAAAGHLPEDVRQYSTAPEDIRRAMLLALGQGDRPAPPGPTAAQTGSRGTLALELLGVVGGGVALAALLSLLGRQVLSRRRSRRLRSSE